MNYLPGQIAAYMRISSLTRTKLNPFDSQLNEIHATFADKYDLTHMQVYQDLANGSNTPENRPELQRLLADVQAGKINLILMTSLDRIGRSEADISDFLGKVDVTGCQIRFAD